MKSEDWNVNERVLRELETILVGENPCAVSVVGGKATCRGGEPCCQHCPALTAGGCKSVPAACKFFFCQQAWDSLKLETKDKIRGLGAEFKGTLRWRGDRQKMTSRPPYIW